MPSPTHEPRDAKFLESEVTRLRHELHQTRNELQSLAVRASVAEAERDEARREAARLLEAIAS